MLCVGAATVAGVPQRWWAVALPDGSLLEGGRGVRFAGGRVEAGGVISLAVEEGDGVEVVSPHGRSWVWTRKQAPVHVRGTVRAGARTIELDGDDGFLDDSAGYHARHTSWRWSAGLGRTDDGRRVAWNLVDGIHDGDASERTVWVDGHPQEVPPQEFAHDLSSVGGLRFREWSARESSLNLVADAQPLPATFWRVQRGAPGRFAPRRGPRRDGGA